ncbi:MAG TPA: DUF58 domain-containing protein [Planctomycetota bacterium]|nr:DUF58 domain-containing protein [Planctomycetota bacterium]
MSDEAATARDADILARLERLATFARKVLAGEVGTASGPRGRFGSGTLFADHRRYTSGDDLRAVDWNAYARLDELYVRVFEPEDATPIGVVVDESPSMHVGDGAKATQARLLGASFIAIGVLALAGAEIVRVPSGDETSLVGKASLVSCLRFLRRAENTGKATLTAAVRKAAARLRRGPLVIVTDGVPLSDLDRALASRGERPALLLHVVDPAELDPPPLGFVRLVDPETGRARRALVTRGLRRRYVSLARARLAEVEALARRAGAAILRVPTTVPFDAAVLSALRRGLVR